MNQETINSFVYILAMLFLIYMLFVDVARFINNRDIKYGLGALLWTYMIVSFR